MLRLLLKVFLIYWCAAGTVILVSDLVLDRHVHHPELTDALESALTLNGRSIVDAYENGRCEQFQKALSRSNDALFLSRNDGTILCGAAGLPDPGKLIRAAQNGHKRVTESHPWFQIVAAPVSSSSGSEYVVLLKSNYSSNLHVFGLLPGMTTIVISCAVTMVLVFLIAIPIHRLREAAGEIAAGRLDTRVRWKGSSPELRSWRPSDDIDRLIYDFNHMAERLQSLAGAQRTLVADISHELRAPLTRLAVRLGIARAQATGEMRESLDDIQSEVRRLNLLIGRVLSLSQIDGSGRTENKRLHTWDRIATNLSPDIREEAARVECQIIFKMKRSGYVSGDAELLRTALENVVRNALLYAASGRLIHIESAVQTRNGKRFSMIRVSDFGPGIPGHEIAFVCEPFFRADRTRHTNREGTGLGLAIVNRIVRLHDGFLEITNRPEGGLSVSISLPVVNERVELIEPSSLHDINA